MIYVSFVQTREVSAKVQTSKVSPAFLIFNCLNVSQKNFSFLGHIHQDISALHQYDKHL